MGRCHQCWQDSCSGCGCSCHVDDFRETERENARLRSELAEAHKPAPEPLYTLYAVASEDDLTKAKWYCTYSASKSSGWKSSFNDAKIWTRRSAAKAKCTALGPSARLVEFVVTKVNVIDNSDQVKKAAERREQEEYRRQIAERRREIEYAEQELQRAQARLARLQQEKQ